MTKSAHAARGQYADVTILGSRMTDSQLGCNLRKAVLCTRDCNYSAVVVIVSNVNAKCHEWWGKRSHASISTAKPIQLVTI